MAATRRASERRQRRRHASAMTPPGSAMIGRYDVSGYHIAAFCLIAASQSVTHVGTTANDTSASAAPPTTAHHDGRAMKYAAPTVGLQMNSTPITGATIAPARSGDHWPALTAAISAAEKKPASGG